MCNLTQTHTLCFLAEILTFRARLVSPSSSVTRPLDVCTHALQRFDACALKICIYTISSLRLCICVHTYACVHHYHRLCLYACLWLPALTSRISVSLFVCCEDGTDLRRRGNEGGDKWGGKRSSLSLEDEDVNNVMERTCGSGTILTRVRIKRRVQEKEVASGESEGVAGLSWSMAKWKGMALCHSIWVKFKLLKPSVSLILREHGLRIMCDSKKGKKKKMLSHTPLLNLSRSFKSFFFLKEPKAHQAL